MSVNPEHIGHDVALVKAYLTELFDMDSAKIFSNDALLAAASRLAVVEKFTGPDAPADAPPGVVDAQVVEVRPGSIGEGLVDCRRRLDRVHELLRSNDAATRAEVARHAEWVVRFLYNNVLHPDAPCGADGWQIRAVRRRKAAKR